MKAIFFYLAFAALIIPSKGYAGGVLDVVQIEFKPLMQTRDGRINNCGVHFSLAVTQDKRVFGIQGSVNEFYFINRMPQIAFKITVVEVVNEKLYRHNLTSAFVQGSNYSTKNFFFNKPSEENGAWLAMTDIEKHPELSSKFILSLADGPWIGFNLGDGMNDFTAKLPVSGSEVAFKDSLTCSIQAIKQVQNELEQIKKN